MTVPLARRLARRPRDRDRQWRHARARLQGRGRRPRGTPDLDRTAIGLFAGYFWLLQRRYPLASDRAALRVGAFWLTLTVLFEFGFGRAVDGKTWAELLADYNLGQGRVWTLVLAWLALGPLVSRRAQTAVGPAPRT